MKKIIILIFLTLKLGAQVNLTPSDCSEAYQICSRNVPVFTPNNGGFNDFGNLNNDPGCAGEENFPIWLRIKIRSGNNFGFTIVPSVRGRDIDFAVYGPNRSCDNLGSPIRCSFAASFSDGRTGLSQNSSFTSEDELGTGFVRWIDNINPGDEFIIWIEDFDAINTGSSFSLEFSGDAIIENNINDYQITFQDQNGSIQTSDEINIQYCGGENLNLFNEVRNLLDRTLYPNISIYSNPEKTNQITSDITNPIDGSRYYLEIVNASGCSISNITVDISEYDFNVNSTASLELSCDDNTVLNSRGLLPLYVNTGVLSVYNISELYISREDALNEINGLGNNVDLLNTPLRDFYLKITDNRNSLGCSKIVSLNTSLSNRVEQKNNQLIQIFNDLNNYPTVIFDSDFDNYIFEPFEDLTLEISYHSTRNDANLNQNTLPFIYQTSQTSETIFVRTNNLDLNCTEIFEVELVSIYETQDFIYDIVNFEEDNTINPNINDIQSTILDNLNTINGNNINLEIYRTENDRLSRNNQVSGIIDVNTNDLLLFANQYFPDYDTLTRFQITLNEVLPNDYEKIICQLDGFEVGRITPDSLNNELNEIIESDTIVYYLNGSDGEANSNFLNNSDEIDISNGQSIFAVQRDSLDRIIRGTEITFSLSYPENFSVETEAFCPGTSISLSAPEGFFAFVWGDERKDSIIEITEAGSYPITVFNSFGCKRTKSFVVNELEKPEITALNISNKSLKPEYTLGDLPYTYFLNEKETEYEDLNNLDYGTYFLKVEDANGCFSDETVFGILFIPDFISPNEDGYNETWTIKGSQAYPEGNIKVFNRYGRKVADFNANEGWDGKYKNKLLPSDNYWYILTLPKPDGRIIKNNITIKRR